MKVMKKFCIIVSLIMIIGCGGGGSGDGGSVGTAPTINNVVLTDENFIPKSQFDIGDTANILVQASDPDKNMKKLLIEQYFPNDSTGNPYYGPDVIALPSQSDITMTYHLIGRITVDGPAGNWRIEFQIEDSTGLESNLFKVFAVVNRVPSIQVLPSSYNFGNVTVGNSTAPLDLEITNNGSVGLTVNDIILSDTTNFALDLTGGTHPCTTPSRIISAGANCTFEVNFSPASYGRLDAVMTINSDDSAHPTINVPLTGIGQEIGRPSIQVLPSSYDFGTVTPNNSTAPLEVEITNNGSVGLTVNDIILSDTTNFALDLTGGTHPCTTPSRIISAGANCTFEVNFSPGSYNTFDANLIISSNDSNNPTINVPLKGIGKEIGRPSIQVLPSSYDFGTVTPNNSPAALEVEIQNNGSVGLTVNDIMLSNTTNFVLDLIGGTHPCTTPSRTISAGDKCTFEVNFTPGSYGRLDANLMISSNDSNNLTINVPLSGIRDDAVSELNVRINQVESTSCPIPKVTAYVSVTDQGGYPVTTLTVYDFLITEVSGYVGFPTEASFVSDVSATISVALVMDYSLSITGSQDSVDDMQESVDSFVDNLGQDDDAEIIKFATTIAVAQDFTSDKNLLTDAITTPLDVGIHSALYDAVVKAVNDTALSLKDRKAVVVITAGTDDDGSGSPLSTNNLNDVINYANGTGVPIFTVGVGGKINSAVLQQMANDTGGQFYGAATSDNLRNIYNQLASILFQDQYVLTYNAGLVAGKTANLTIKATELTSGVTGNDTKEITPCP